ncbi:MAG: PAS domain-containing protein [Acidimicrobiia bacterium]|nr:PAS domain-containing protein [Acidimicrobiia bacterium]
MRPIGIWKDGGTDRTEASARLPFQRDLLEALVEHAREAVLVLEGPTFGESRVVYASDRFLELSGHGAEDLIGQPPGFLLAPETDPETVVRLVGALEAGGTFDEELRIRHRDGTLLWVEVSGFVHRTTADGPVHYCGLYRDTTEQHLNRRELRTREEWAQALIEGTNDAILVTDDEGIISYSSPAAESTFSFSPRDLVGTSCFDLVHPDDRSRIGEEWSDLFAEEGVYLPAHLRVVRGDGDVRHVSVSARNMLSHPAVGGIVIHVRDVTEQALAEDRLRQSEQWAQALVQGGFDVVTVTDETGRVLYVSPAIEHMLGYTRDEYVGTDQFEYFHPDDRRLAERVFAGELDGVGVRTPTRIRVRRADGSWAHLSLLFTNMLDDEAVRGVVINARDITERWHAEQFATEQSRALEGIRGVAHHSTRRSTGSRR